MQRSSDHVSPCANEYVKKTDSIMVKSDFFIGRLVCVFYYIIKYQNRTFPRNRLFVRFLSGVYFCLCVYLFYTDVFFLDKSCRKPEILLYL